MSAIEVTALLKKSTFRNERCARKKTLSLVWGIYRKNPSFAITVWLHSASLVMPDSEPRDGFFYLALTPMIDPNNLLLRIQELLQKVNSSPHFVKLLFSHMLFMVYILQSCDIWLKQTETDVSNTRSHSTHKGSPMHTQTVKDKTCTYRSTRYSELLLLTCTNVGHYRTDR